MRVKISGVSGTCRVFATDFQLDVRTSDELVKKLKAIDGVSFVNWDGYSVAVNLKSTAFVWVVIQKQVLAVIKEMCGDFVVEIDLDVRFEDAERTVSVLVNKVLW